jgi:hypothetical protein
VGYDPQRKDYVVSFRVSGLVSFLLAAIWAYRWEALRSFLYEQGFQAMSSLESDALLHWGVPLLLAAIGVYLFWKTGNAHSFDFEEWSPSFLRIPLHIAARRVYEAAEKAGVVDLILSPTSSPDSKLQHFKMLMFVDDRVRLFGAKPPSTKSRLIPKNEFAGHEIYPPEGEVSRLDSVYPNEPPAYVNVTVPRSDLARIIKIYLDEYVTEAKNLRKGRWT